MTIDAKSGWNDRAAGTTDVFPGYNLRGLIFAYLEAHGWTWDESEETWARSGITFSGPYASDMAIHEQVEFEEGRRRPVWFDGEPFTCEPL